MDPDITEFLSGLTLDVLGPIIQAYLALENPLIWVRNGSNTITVHRFNIPTHSWSLLDQFKLPARLNHHNQCVVDTMFYSVNKEDSMITPFRYDIIDHHVVLYPPIKVTFGLSWFWFETKPVVIGSNVYMLISNIRSKQGYLYKLIGKTPDWRWVQCSNPNGGWYNCAVTVAAGKLYLPLISEYIYGERFTCIEVYDPDMDRWDILLPVESGHVTSIATLHNELYIMVDTEKADVHNIHRYDGGKWVTITQYLHRPLVKYCEIEMFGIGDLLYVKMEEMREMTNINVYNIILNTWSVLDAPIMFTDQVFCFSTEYTTW